MFLDRETTDEWFREALKNNNNSLINCINRAVPCAVPVAQLSAVIVGHCGRLRP